MPKLNDDEIAKVLKMSFEAKMPGWKQEYMERICRNLQVHTKGLLFSKVDTLFPHEHPDSKAHCVNTYEPITKGSIWKGINGIIRIFYSSSFVISASDNTLELINDDWFEGKNLFSYFLDEWADNAIATDPNMLCAVYPEDAGGDRIRFIRSEHIKLISDEMIVFISEDESEKEYGVQDSVVKREVFYDSAIDSVNARTVVEKTYNQHLFVKITKAVYHVFTKDYFIRFSQVGTSFDYEIIYFQKQLTALPAFPLSGVNLILDINESFVAPFIPFGNLSLLQHRNHRAVDLMFSYPRMSEIQTPCDNLSCVDGKSHDQEGNETICSRCKGSGYVTVQSPYKVYQKKIDTGLSDPETVKQLLAAPPVDFHTPDVSILNYSKDSWKEYLNMAEEAIFVQQKKMTGNVESAEAKKIDKEAEYAWFLNISKAFNTDLTKVIQAIEEYMNASPVTVSIDQPSSFAIVTEIEAFEALDAIISSDMPIFIKSQKVENFINKYVSKSSPVVKALKVLKRVDPLLFYTNRDVATFKSNGIVDSRAWAIHVYAYPVLMKLYDEDDLLFDQDERQIAEKVLNNIPELPGGDLKDRLSRVA